MFVYPDLETALIGKFQNGVMKYASPAKVTSERCKNGLKEIKVSILKSTTPMYKYIKPTKHLITNKPTLQDPLEERNVFVSTSKVITAEYGLFAKKNFEVGQLLSYYSGVIWNTTEDEILPEGFSSSDL